MVPPDVIGNSYSFAIANITDLQTTTNWAKQPQRFLLWRRLR